MIIQCRESQFVKNKCSFQPDDERSNPSFGQNHMTYHMARICLSCTLSSVVCLYCRKFPAHPLLLCLWFHSKFQSLRHASVCLQASAGDLNLLCSSLLCIYIRLCIGIGEVQARMPKFMCLFAASMSISTWVVWLNSFCGVAIYLQFCGHTTGRLPSLFGTLTFSTSVLIEPQTCSVK